MSGLDPVGRAKVRDIILQLQAKGKTVLFSSHILSDVEMICNRVGIIIKGELREAGSVDSLLEENIKEIEIVSVNLNSDETLRIEKIANKIVTLDGKIMITVSNERKRDEILEIIATKNGRLQSVENRRETLEDFFMKKYVH
jgi:ABC-2 type transport system ATP-binding protein